MVNPFVGIFVLAMMSRTKEPFKREGIEFPRKNWEFSCDLLGAIGFAVMSISGISLAQCHKTHQSTLFLFLVWIFDNWNENQRRVVTNITTTLAATDPPHPLDCVCRDHHHGWVCQASWDYNWHDGKGHCGTGCVLVSFFNQTDRLCTPIRKIGTRDMRILNPTPHSALHAWDCVLWTSSLDRETLSGSASFSGSYY